MRKIIFIITFSSILFSCGGDGVEDLDPVLLNSAPSRPVLTSPINGQLCIDNTVSFQWNSSTDPDNDVITYEIQVATDNQFNQIAHTLTGSSTSQSISLDRGIAYYWRVKATDSENLSSNYSDTFNFYTEGVGVSNYLPFSPDLVTPTLNATIQTTSITLEWTASDVDANDVLTFDVFFGTDNPPTTRIGDNQAENTLDVDIIAATNYYWYVVVKDDQGGETIGQIWNFKTE
jgi:hypothetical protein